jgi:hypothetical protein
MTEYKGKIVELPKAPKDVQTWKEKAALIKREIVFLRNKHFKTFLKI